MTTRPWMPLYVAEYMADTAHLGALESGAYLHLIFYYWQTGALPSDNKELARIAKVSSHSWKKLCPVLQKFFYDGWKHKRIEKELAKVCEISEKRAAAARSRHEKAAANAPANAEQKQTHLHSHSHIQREEEKKDIGPRPKRTRARARTPLPPDWKPTEQDVAYAADRGFTELQIAGMAEQFAPHHRAKGSEMADWHAAWCTWCTNEIKWNRGPSNGHRGSRPLQDDSKSISRAAERLAELAERGEFSFGPRPSLLPEDDARPVQLLSKG